MRGWLVLFLVGCGADFETPKAPDSKPPVSEPKAVIPDSPEAAEPFAIAVEAFEVDAFPNVRPAVALPADARLDTGLRYATVGKGPDAKSAAPHFVTVAYVGDIAVFDRDVAAPMRAAAPVPADTWLTWIGPKDGKFESIVLRTPYLVTSKDVATASSVETTNTQIILGPGAGHTDVEKTWAVQIVLRDEASARIEAWYAAHPEHPLAFAVHGRVVDSDKRYGISKDFKVQLPWARPQEREALTKKLADEIMAKR